MFTGTAVLTGKKEHIIVGMGMGNRIIGQQFDLSTIEAIQHLGMFIPFIHGARGGSICSCFPWVEHIPRTERRKKGKGDD